ncbi:hypothetical protein PSPO01_10787 [Paraphaeosphaeria sporulosa]
MSRTDHVPNLNVDLLKVWERSLHQFQHLDECRASLVAACTQEMNVIHGMTTIQLVFGQAEVEMDVETAELGE